MKNSYKISKIIGLVIVAIQLLSCLFFAIIYLNNFFDVRNNIDPSIFYLILCIFVFIDLIFIGVVIGIASKYRMSTNLRAADLIGEDVQEAYNFGLIGLVAVNENNVVIWVSEFFKDKQIDILDTNILEWQPKLLELQGENSSSVTCSLEINSRNYEVKHLVDAGLYIFKDTTDYTTIYDYSIKQAVVIGMIMIDNFSDLSGSADDANDVISKVRNAIFEYARDFGVLIKRYKNDGYFMTCNYESLKKMEDDKFSLLEKIHIIGEKEDTPPTLSIGIAHDFPDVVKLNEMASSAIDIAMSRGGDQVVVSRYGQELVFYGGKSEAQENRNQVKVRDNCPFLRFNCGLPLGP